MKVALLSLCTLVFHLCLQGQNVSDIGKIALSVVMPSEMESLEPSQIAKLESKITQIVTNSGLAANGFGNNFIIYPKFDVYDEKMVEGGMQNITVVNCEFRLFVKQIESEIIFSSVDKKLTGSGVNRKSALTDAISKLSTQDEKFKIFVESAKIKMINYYEDKCEDIVIKSDALVKMQKYDEAIGLLMTVPEEVSGCHNRIQKKSIDAYKAYQNQICSELFLKAKNTSLEHKYKEALDILAQIDPSAGCSKQAQQLANNCAARIDADLRKAWEFKMRVYNDRIEMEKFRINAAKEIALAYYKSRPVVRNNFYIIR